MSSSNFMLVKGLHRKAEYRYLVISTVVGEDGDVRVLFSKLFEGTGKNFKIDDNNIPFATRDQIRGELPVSNF